MGEPKVIVIKCCKHCGAGLGVESCGTYCPNFGNNNPAQRQRDLKTKTPKPADRGKT